MVTWCSKAVNRNFPSPFATLRTRSSPLGPFSRLGVRHRLGCSMFSLVSALPSTPSAGGWPTLVRMFRRYYNAVRLPAAVHVGIIAHRFPPPTRIFSTAGGDWASRFSRVEFLYMHGVFDSAGPRRTCVIARRLIAFRLGRHRQLPAFPFSELIAQPAYTPVQRFECGLAAALAWLGARMVRYAFPV